MDLSQLDNKQLLEVYCALMSELRERGVVRSANNPVADYTETLVSNALELQLEKNSKAGYDAIDKAKRNQVPDQGSPTDRAQRVNPAQRGVGHLGATRTG